jgi:hypothetical protein
VGGPEGAIAYIMIPYSTWDVGILKSSHDSIFIGVQEWDYAVIILPMLWSRGRSCQEHLVQFLVSNTLDYG